MTAIGRAAVITVTPPDGPDADLDATQPLGTLIWDRPDALYVPIRPRQSGRSRIPDLACDLLNLLGHTGAQPAVRKHLDADLFRVLPFLHTSPIKTLVLDNADQLDRGAVEDVLALGALLRRQIWLVWRAAADTRVAALLETHGPRISYRQAHHHWAGQPAPTAAACAAACLTETQECATHTSRVACVQAATRHLLEHDLATADQIRHTLLTLAAEATTADTWRLIGCMRDALRPAKLALEALGLPLQLNVRDVQPDGSAVHVNGQPTPVPHSLRQLLQRQRLAALAAGQYADDPLLNYFADKRPMPVLTP